MSLVLLIGLVGGLSMGALAAARRTESSFPTFLASTNPSNLSLATALWNPALGYTTGYNGPLVATIARLPHVRRAESYSGIYSEPIGANGQPTSAAQKANFDVNGSVDGLYFNQDRVTVLQGRMADPKRANEIMMTVGAADSLGLHVGQTVTWGTYTSSQFESANAPPALHERLTLVGTVVLNNAVVQDEIDANGPTTVIFTPALTRRLDNCCSNYTFTYLQLDQGSRDVPAVEAELERVIPSKLPHDFYDTSIDVTKAQNAIKPEAIALAVFGLIAGLAAILIAGQVIGRQLGFWAPEERTLRALGANPFMTAGDALLGIMGAVVVGALVAVAVAVALSPLAPLGPVRPYYPDPGVAFDWTVLGLGVAVLVVVLGSVAIVLAVQRAPQRTGTRRRPRAPSRIEGAASAGGLPVSAVTGIRFALEPGAESEAVPVRSAILGATLAVVVIIATVVFGTSLNSLVSHPRLYGWNWNYALIVRRRGRRHSRRAVGDAARPRSERGGLVRVLVRQLADRRPHGARPRWVTRCNCGATDPDRPRLRRAGSDRARSRHAGPDPQVGRGLRHGALRDDHPAPPPHRRHGHHARSGRRRRHGACVHGDGSGRALPAPPRIGTQPVQRVPGRP